MSIQSRPGVSVMLAKLAPKLLKIIAKVGDILWSTIKSLFGVKAIGAVGSLGLYTYLYTWQMGVSLVVFIGIHEYGHLWAMKKCGIRTRGMFFIPGFGAVAVADEKFGSARNEAYIALMGPIFGIIGFIAPMLLVFWQTGENVWAAVAGFMTLINLLNLLPVHPLDGGRVFKALAYSKNAAISLGIIVAVSLVTAVAGVVMGFSLLFIMAAIGLWEISTDFGIQDYVKKLLATIWRVLWAVGTFFVVSGWLTGFMERFWFWTILWGMGCLVLASMGIQDVRTLTTKRGVSMFRYPVQVLKEAKEGVLQCISLRHQKIDPIDNYPRMDRGEKFWWGGCFIGLVLVHMIIIYLIALVPGAGIGKEFLQ